MRRSSRPPINMAWPWCSPAYATSGTRRSEEHTSELQSRSDLVCRLLLEKKKKKIYNIVSLRKKKEKKIARTFTYAARYILSQRPNEKCLRIDELRLENQCKRM